MIRARIAMPETASAGESIEVKTLVSHPMESGFRFDNSGEAIPRNIISKFEVIYMGEVAFSVKFGPGIAANPFLGFYLTLENSGLVEFVWTEQDGEVTRMSRDVLIDGAVADSET